MAYLTKGKLSKLVNQMVGETLNEALLDRKKHKMLFEGRFEDAQKKYPEVAEELAQLKAAGVDSKYAQWFGKQWPKVENWRKEDLPIEKVAELFKAYNNLLNKKLIPDSADRDINQFPGWVFFQEFVESMQRQQTRKEEEKARSNDKEVIYKDDQYLVIKPNTTEASCRFGKGTRWCISAKEENQFKNYTNQGAKFYFFIDRKNKDQGGKDALAVTDSGVEIYDAQDRLQNLDYLLNKYPPEMHGLIYELAFGAQAADYKEFLSNP